MFVIPCFYDGSNDHVITLVCDILQWHSNPEILVVDSDSPDKSYFEVVTKLGAKVLDAANKNYHMGAYWLAYDNFKRSFYYFLHDSCRIKSNITYLQERTFTALAYFDFCGAGDVAAEALLRYTDYNVPNRGRAIYGPIFFCRQSIMQKLKARGFHRILPTHSYYTPNPPINGIATYALEGALGIAIAQEGYDIKNTSLLGDIHLNGPGWMTGASTAWQTPIEKFHVRRF
jgi:hypothetical protein